MTDAPMDSAAAAAAPTPAVDAPVPAPALPLPTDASLRSAIRALLTGADLTALTPKLVRVGVCASLGLPLAAAMDSAEFKAQTKRILTEEVEAINAMPAAHSSTAAAARGASAAAPPASPSQPSHDRPAASRCNHTVHAAAADPVAPGSADAAAGASSSPSAAAVMAPVPAAAVAASSSSRRVLAPRRHADPPSLFSANSPDPLGLILSFVLIDLPIAAGQSYFPKELVRIVHEYASEACFIVQLDRTDNDGLELTHTITCACSTSLLEWMGDDLPDQLRPNTVEVNNAGRARSLFEEPEFWSFSDCCLVDEEIRIEYGADISRLLHAQLRPNEYRMCYLEIGPNEDGEPFDPTKYLHEKIDVGESEGPPLDITQHNQFCLDELHRRKAAILARGQKPVAVGLSELLKRIRSSLQAGRLPRDLSPRPCDWAPLFRWIRDYQANMNELRFGHSEIWPYIFDYPALPELSAVIVRSTTDGSPVSIHGEAHLWSYDQDVRVLTKPAASMMIDKEDRDGVGLQRAQHSAERSSGACSSASSFSAPRVSSLSADEESDARAAPRQRRD